MAIPSIAWNKVQTLPGLGRSIVGLIVKPDLQQRVDGNVGSSGLSLEGQERM